ncbi:ATP-binding cassette subfamily B protein [Microbacter margulisiae]|uniref:ATP-binding cassette subfamily B protein n=2 Tax=Microbacter margulisiae TaxID=1350067 RepID=A0A7W5DN83_9PORP|nr:ATP-binding cassette subfamily B protein [Microbacter margulisiae]
MTRQEHISKAAGKKDSPNIWVVLQPYRLLVALLIVFALLSNGVNLVIPKLISRAIDDFSKGHFSYQTVIVEFLVAALVILVFTFLQGVLQTYVSERVAKDLRTQLAEKISRQSYAFIQQANPAKLLTNFTSDIDAVKMFVSMAVVSLMSSVFIIVGASILLISINLKLALSVLAIIPVISGAFFFVFRKVRVLFKKSREVIDWLNRIINESIMGAALIRVVNAQMLEYNKFLEANAQAKTLGISILRLFATLIPIVVFVSNLASLTILTLGGHFVIIGSMSLGNFAAFSSYLSLLIFPIMVIGFISNFIVRASVSYGRIHSVLHAVDTKDTGTLKRVLVGNIELKEAYVCYGDNPVLKHISFSVKEGSRSAVIGPTAAGKSQLLYLLTGLIEPRSGVVLFDGIDFKEYDKESLQHQIGIVFQDSVMFNMSLRDNIAFNGSITDEALQKAIETAELTDFIRNLPEGLDTVVSERGNSLSGGQKQRIMLARALAICPKILLLDDFTARVDTQTEQKILKNISRNYPDMTLLSVTQKIASVIHYENIILMEEGEILAEGTHKSLMQDSPEYVQIYNSQRSTNRYEALAK